MMQKFVACTNFLKSREGRFGTWMIHTDFLKLAAVGILLEELRPISVLCGGCNVSQSHKVLKQKSNV